MSQRLDNAIAQIEKLYGKGSLMYIGDEQIVKCEVISTGSLFVDKATVIGGFPKGRMCEIFGPESSGKTTLALHIIAEAQKEGLGCAFIDAEHALDINYAGNLGVDVKKILLSQPDYGEQALDITDKLMETKELGLIVIDSVAALTPKSEIEGEYGDPQMGSHARLMSQALRKLTSKVKKSNTCVVFINQVRTDLGKKFGNPEETTGGKALKFWASIRAETRYAGQVKDGEQNVANKTKIKIVKNKLAPPFRVAEVEIRFGKGIDFIKEVIDASLENGIIKKSGAWYTIGEDRCQGEQQVRKYLEKHPEVLQYFREQVLELEGQDTAVSENDEEIDY